ncbi:Disease resistance protein RPS2, partial [Mucuna pruriens]
MWDLVSLIVDNVVKPVASVTSKQVLYIKNYNQNVVELKDTVKNLAHEKETVDHQGEKAKRNLQNIEGKVEEWYRKVEIILTEVEEFDNDEGHRKTHLWNRYRLSRQAKKKAEDIQKLIDEASKFNAVGFAPNITSNEISLFNVGFEKFGSTKSTMEKILAKLEDSTVRMIGLHGPGGVGKSSLIKEIGNHVKHKKLFNKVAMTEITANPNILKNQEDIAYVLELPFKGKSESEIVRADCLRRSLKKEKNMLVILDDIWEGFELDRLGLLLDDDDDLSKMTSNDKQDVNLNVVKKEISLDDNKGCKILLTSRGKNILSDYIKDDESILELKKLDEKDALILFQKVSEISDEMSNSKQDIVEILEYCEGLPMEIVTFGRALRKARRSGLQAKLGELKKKKKREVGLKRMDILVRLNYDNLENEELKSIFLLCAQMGHPPLIMDLVKYCFGLGILEEVASLEQARERISSSIEKLKESRLVESSGNHFKMHDMVRDAALSIAHKDHNVFTLRNGKLHDWHGLERCTSISICNSDIVDELPKAINCPQLKFFQIDTDDPSLEIPDSFFRGMRKLRVLSLTGFRRSSLPSSIQYLSNLRMLCLERCTLVCKLSILGKLKKLRILSFSGSEIQNLPAEL